MLHAPHGRSVRLVPTPAKGTMTRSVPSPFSTPTYRAKAAQEKPLVAAGAQGFGQKHLPMARPVRQERCQSRRPSQAGVRRHPRRSPPDGGWPSQLAATMPHGTRTDAPGSIRTTRRGRVSMGMRRGSAALQRQAGRNSRRRDYLHVFDPRCGSGFLAELKSQNDMQLSRFPAASHPSCTLQVPRLVVADG